MNLGCHVAKYPERKPGGLCRPLAAHGARKPTKLNALATVTAIQLAQNGTSSNSM
jgi:hypothetical protein